jgi:hypothetical protein
MLTRCGAPRALQHGVLLTAQACRPQAMVQLNPRRDAEGETAFPVSGFDSAWLNEPYLNEPF